MKQRLAPAEPAARWWSEERKAQLVRLWPDQELSTTEIGRIMGRTKNAVIGAAGRLGLGTKNPNYRPPGDNPPPKPANAFDGIKPGHCLWPRGHPGTPEFRFCGTQAVLGRPYCEAHCRVAYQPLTPAPRMRKTANPGEQA